MSDAARSTDDSVQYTEQTVSSVRGIDLFVHRWAPADGDPKAELLIFHGFGEHSDRYRRFAHHLAAQGIACTAGDFRGHGRSGGQRGHVSHFDDYLVDGEKIRATLQGDWPKFLLGHSMGGLIALDFVGTQRAGSEDLKGLLLSNPFLEVAIEVPAAKLLFAKVAARILPRVPVPTGLPASSLSHDEAMVEAYERDTLVFGTATPGWLHEVSGAQVRVKAMSDVHIPLLYAYSDADAVAAPAANAQLSGRVNSPDKSVVMRAGEYHEILNEVDRASLYTLMADWILKRL